MLSSELAREGIDVTLLQRIARENKNPVTFIKSLCEERTPLLWMDSEQFDDLARKLQEIQKIVDLRIRYPFLSSDVCKKISNDAIQNLENDPYILVRELKGKEALMTSDKIAKHNRWNPSHEDRLNAYFVHLIQTSVQMQKHYWFPLDDVLLQYIEQLGSADWTLSLDTEAARAAIMKFGVVRDHYVTDSHHAEEEIRLAHKLKRLIEMPVSEEASEGAILTNDVELHEKQYEALRSALFCTTIITGKAGTGKTQVVKLLVDNLEARNVAYCLCAPTGKAAARMSEGLKCTATTIHYAIMKGHEEPVVAIIDETSMLAPHLLLRFLSSVNVTRLILIGDPNQLPSIDPGSLLRDLIRSRSLCHVELTHIYRQANNSGLVEAAHSVLSGEAKDWCSYENDSFSLQLTSSSLESAVKKVGELHAAGEDVQLLVQLKASAQKANMELQEVYNPQQSPVVDRMNRAPWKSQDTIISTENYYVDGVLKIVNGSIGKITKVDAARKRITCKFEQETRVLAGGTDEIEHAYALTVHKYQGSEIPICVVALDPVKCMQTRQALYTAITRGKKKVFVYASPYIWHMACTTNDKFRVTFLAEEISRALRKRDACH